MKPRESISSAITILIDSRSIKLAKRKLFPQVLEAISTGSFKLVLLDADLDVRYLDGHYLAVLLSRLVRKALHVLR